LLKSLPDIMGKRGKKLTPIPGTIPSLIDPPTGCVFHPRCRFAQDVCSKVVPPEAKVEEEHFSACLFWDSEGVIEASEEVRVGR
jgi:oligopeptide transport system ATP-binding protein